MKIRNICFISHLPELGGAECVLLETIDVLRDKGIKCSVLLHKKNH